MVLKGFSSDENSIIRSPNSEKKMKSITIDEIEYDLSNASEEVNTQLRNIEFVNDLILQKNNELQIALTAKIGYSRALKREMSE